MPVDYLNNHPNFGELLSRTADEMGILPALVEKD